jgi:glycosyltransferase involved in cell wall biosynthesis
MKLCIFGSHSFADSMVRGGTQYMAQALAANGHEVSYVAAPVSAAVGVIPALRSKLIRARAPFVVAPNLTEFSPITVVPARVAAAADVVGLGGLLLALNHAVEHSPAHAIERRVFDICLCAAGANLPFVRKTQAARTVYRRNDVLARFPGVPAALVEAEWSLLRSGRVDLVSCVNELLAEEVRAKVPGIPVAIVPNGIMGDLHTQIAPDPVLLQQRESNVLFIGSFSPWVDVGLILQTAALLPDRSFHLCGPWHMERPHNIPRNVHVHAAVSHSDAIAKMKACAVGIIPSGDGNKGRMVVKPLKYYEYLASGMGVAATTWGGSGLNFATVGDDPVSFARAIEQAPALAALHASEIATEVAAMDWRRLLPSILGVAAI